MKIETRFDTLVRQVLHHRKLSEQGLTQLQRELREALPSRFLWRESAGLMERDDDDCRALMPEASAEYVWRSGSPMVVHSIDGLPLACRLQGLTVGREETLPVGTDAFEFTLDAWQPKQPSRAKRTHGAMALPHELVVVARQDVRLRLRNPTREPLDVTQLALVGYFAPKKEVSREGENDD